MKELKRTIRVFCPGNLSTAKAVPRGNPIRQASETALKVTDNESRTTSTRVSSRVIISWKDCRNASVRVFIIQIRYSMIFTLFAEPFQCNLVCKVILAKLDRWIEFQIN